MGLLEDVMSWTGEASGGGNTPVGIAQGRITIDTQSLAQARATVVNEARIMGDALKQNLGEKTAQGAQQAEASLSRLQNTLNSIGRAGSLALGAIATAGIASAQRIKEMELVFRTLVGSEEEATAQMAELREMAERTGQPFLELVNGARMILPAMRGTNAELTKALSLAQRLAILDPAQGVSGAAFAIREFLNGEYLSLARRLELDRGRLQRILAEADGDQAKALAGLDEYISSLGMTDQALMELGQSGVYSFRVLRDEGMQTLNAFFSPFLNDFVIPLVRGFGDLLELLRQTSPELQRIIGISAGLAAVGALGQRLPVIGTLPGGAVLGKAGVLAAATYGGSQLGIAGVRLGAELGVGGLERFEGKSQGEAAGMITDTLGQVVFLIAAALMELIKAIQQGGQYLGNAFEVAKAVFEMGAALIGIAIGKLINAIGSGAGSLLDAFADLLEEFNQTINLGPLKIRLDVGDTPTKLRELGEGARHLGDDLITGKEKMDGWLATLQRGAGLTDEQKAANERLETSLNAGLLTFGQFIGVIDRTNEEIGGLSAHWERAISWLSVGGKTGEIAINDEVIAAWTDFQNDLEAIELNALQARLEATEQYEKQRAQTIAAYEKQLADMAEDEAIRRQRALAELARQETAIRTTLAKALAEETEKHELRLQELQEDYREEEARRAEAFQRNLRDIQRDGRESMLRAAARLDASGVLEAQRTMSRQIEDTRETYERERAERAERLQEAITQENESYQARMEQAQEHAEEQLEALRERFEREERLTAEDNDRRLARMKREHQETLRQLEIQFRERLRQIALQAYQERLQRQKDFMEQFNALQLLADTHTRNLINIHRAGQEQVERDIRDWWQRVHGIIFGGAGSVPGTGREKTTTIPGTKMLLPGRQIAGRIWQTGAHWLERDEHVLRPDVARFMRRLLGGEITQGGLMAMASAAVGGGGSRSVTWTGSVIVNEARSPRETAQAVRAEVLQLFEELAS